MNLTLSEVILSDSGAFAKNASVSRMPILLTFCQVYKTGQRHGRLIGLFSSDAFQFSFGELKTTVKNHFPVFVENQNARIRIYVTFL